MNTEEFTFRYYLDSARLRLSQMAIDMPGLINPGWAVLADGGIKNEWTASQEAIEQAIFAFRRILDTRA